jgi:hypothetical protein
LKQRIKEAAQRLHHDRSDEADSASSGSEGDDEGDVRADGPGAPLEKKTSRGDSKLPIGSPTAEKEKLPTSSDSINPTTRDQQAKHEDSSTTAKGDSIHPPPSSSPSATPTNSVHDHLASASKLSKSEASKRLHPHTEGSKEEDYVPPAADGEGKGKQHAADPSKDDEIHIVIDGEEQVIVRFELHRKSSICKTSRFLTPFQLFLWGFTEGSDPAVRYQPAPAAPVRLARVRLPGRSLPVAGHCERQGATEGRDHLRVRPTSLGYYCLKVADSFAMAFNIFVAVLTRLLIRIGTLSPSTSRR